MTLTFNSVPVANNIGRAISLTPENWEQGPPVDIAIGGSAVVTGRFVGFSDTNGRNIFEPDAHGWGPPIKTTGALNPGTYLSIQPAGELWAGEGNQNFQLAGQWVQVAEESQKEDEAE